jgi:hypothetical protein
MQNIIRVGLKLASDWGWIVLITLGALYLAPEVTRVAGRIFWEAPKSVAGRPDYIGEQPGGQLWAYFLTKEKATGFCASEILKLTGNPYYRFACEWKNKKN